MVHPQWTMSTVMIVESNIGLAHINEFGSIFGFMQIQLFVFDAKKEPFDVGIIGGTPLPINRRIFSRLVRSPSGPGPDGTVAIHGWGLPDTCDP